jgi:hypothetical protein
VIALVIAITGNAFAGPLADVASTLINGSSIAKRSIPGNRLRSHTLTGTQINLAKLGTVPNAAALGGAVASSYLRNSKLVRWSFSMNKGDSPHTFMVAPLTFTTTCAADTTKTEATLGVTTSESGTFVTTSPDALPGTGTTINAGDPPYTIVEQDTATANDGNSTEFAAFDPAGKLAVFSTAQTIGLAINTTGADCRFFGYLINDA